MDFDVTSFLMGAAAGGGGGGRGPLWILNPDITDAQVAAWPYASSIDPTGGDVNYGASTLALAPIVAKINGSAYYSMQANWLSQKGTYGGENNKAFIGRYGFDRSGLFFATKVPASTYNNLHIRFEITTGRFSGGYLQVSLVKSMTYASNDVYPAASEVLYTKTLATNTIADNEQIIDVSGIVSDFYLCFVDWSGFSKLRSIYLD